MKKLFTIICFVLTVNRAWSQKLNVDSLVNVAVLLGQQTKVGSPPNRDSLLKLLPLTKKPADRIKLIYDIILNYGELDPKKAFYYHHKILDEVKKNNDKVGEAVILSELGFIVSQNGDYAEGIKIITQALRIAEETGNNQAIGIVYDNLGVCHDNSNLYLRKLYFKNALKFSELGGDDFFVCYELGNLARIYYLENKKDSATYYVLKAFELAVRKNLQQALPSAISNILADQDSKKLKYLNAVLELPYSKMNTSYSVTLLSSIGKIYLDAGKIDSGIFYAKRAYQNSMNAAFVSRIGPAQLLANLYKARNADSALKYTDIYYQARDSSFNVNKIEQTQSMAFAEQQRQQEAAAQKQAYQTTQRTYLLTAIILFFVILAFVFWRNNRQKQKANHLLTEQKEEIETQRDNLGAALNELKTTQSQLVQREKMASLGELTAGIAHEIQNPLNFVNNFSEVNAELLAELKQEISAKNYKAVSAIADDLIANEQKINMHGKRADSIVKGMLQHSQSSSGKKEPADINALADEYLRLAYHGLRAKDKSFNAESVTRFDEKLPKINVIPQDIGRVLLNLFNNAFYAVNQKLKMAGADYKPEISVTTSTENGQVIISVKDNGTGIPDAIKEKIMQPFFTTKATGEGTGLGLSLTYDTVVKGHGGKIEVNSNEGEFTEFTVTLPLS